jgi:8-oxo-dGTP pyrophosphatase MutT (NUDIX family)
MSLLDRIRTCQIWDRARYRPFRIAGQAVGWVRDDFAERLREFPQLFLVSAAAVDLDPGLTRFEQRSKAVEEVLLVLKAEGLVPGWRDEPYPVGSDFYAPPLMQMERAAVPLFGVRAYGVHVNGFVGSGDDQRLWVGKRAANKQTAPGKLDHLVAGGQPMGLSLMENVIKESAEEAGMDAALARRARPVGLVSYITERSEGLRNDICFAFDIALPDSFVPHNTDGEIESFSLWPIADVRGRMAATEDFKFNVALVNIDFLIRHGHLSPDEPGYVDLVEGLRL